MKWPRFALVSAAVLVAVALFLYVSAREQLSLRPKAIDVASSKSNKSSDEAARNRSQAATSSKATQHKGEPDVQPPEGEIWLLGRIKYSPSNACEYVATFDALKADVQIEPMRAEGGAMHWLRESADLPASGESKLSVQIPKKEPPDDPEMSPRVMLDPGRKFLLRVRSRIQCKGRLKSAAGGGRKVQQRGPVLTKN